MNRIVIIVLFSSLFVLYLYKYSYPKVLEGAIGDDKEDDESKEEKQSEEEEEEEVELTKRQKRRRKKFKKQKTKRIRKEFRAQKQALNKSNLSNKEKKELKDKLKQDRDYKKQVVLDNMSREENEFYNNYEGMVLESAKNFLQKLHAQIISLGQSIFIQLDLSNENIRIEDRVSKDINSFVRLLRTRISFISKLPKYLNEHDEKQFERLQSELLNDVNNNAFIENVSQTIEKLIKYYEQKGSALRVPTLESSSSDFNYHFNSIDNISDKLVVLKKIMKETNGITIKKDSEFGPGAVPISTKPTTNITTEDN